MKSERCPTLTTPRLTLRLPTPNDLDAFAHIFADPEVCKYIGDGKPRPRDRVEQSLRNCILCWERKGFGPFAVLHQGRIIGDTLLYPIARSGTDFADFSARGPEIEIGYRFAKSAWGQGFATEAAKAAMEWAFSSAGPNLPELIAVTYPENTASQRVLEKIGMQRIGETRDYYNAVTSLFRRKHPTQ